MTFLRLANGWTECYARSGRKWGYLEVGIFGDGRRKSRGRGRVGEVVSEGSDFVNLADVDGCPAVDQLRPALLLQPLLQAALAHGCNKCHINH